MRSEKGNFRGMLFGGFNRRDVIEYVTKLAAERNHYKTRVEEMESRLDDLNERLELAEAETAAANQRAEEIRVAAIDDAITVLNELEVRYKEVCSDMDVTTNHVKWELGRMGDGLSLVSSVLDSAGRRFAELRAIVRHMKTGDVPEAEIPAIDESIDFSGLKDMIDNLPEAEIVSGENAENIVEPALEE